MKNKSDAKKITARCETCNYCKYPRTSDDNGGACKCKLMKYKTIDIIVTGGGSPAWCPINKMIDADAAPLGKHESAQLNALCEKTVRIKFVDGCVGVGVLYKDTLATLRQCAAYDNTNVIGYYITTETRQIHFKKSHVKNIREAQ